MAIASNQVEIAVTVQIHRVNTMNPVSVVFSGLRQPFGRFIDKAVRAVVDQELNVMARVGILEIDDEIQLAIAVEVGAAERDSASSCRTPWSDRQVDRVVVGENSGSVVVENARIIRGAFTAVRADN